jgi:hypothetical protein
VIVRILGEGQYTVPDDQHGALEKLEAAIDQAVDSGDEGDFATALAALTTEVRRIGEPLADDAFAPSDLVVPFADATLAETKALLADHGESEGGKGR